jgi:hypothetical protein
MKLRYRMKKSIDKLKGERQDEYMDNLRALNTIDPFKHLTAYAVLLLVFLFTGYYRAIGVLIIVYFTWVLMYIITWVGVKKMYKDSVREQEIEDVLQEKV